MGGGAIDLDTQVSIKNVFPQETSSALLSGLSGSILADKQFVNYRPISIGPLNPERHWTLIESLPASKVYSSIYTFYIVLGILALILIAGVVIATRVFSKKLTWSIDELVKGVAAMAKRGPNDLDYHIKVTSKDEIAFLAFSFNKMIFNLGAARKRLQAYADNLERKVKDKTKEILEKAGQQEVVAKIGDLLLTNLEVQGTIDRAPILVSKTLEVEFCEVLLLGKSQKSLHLVSGVGWNEGLVGHVTVDVGAESQTCYTLKELKPVAVRDIRAEKRFPVSPILNEHGVVSGLSVPMAVGNHAVGVMGVYTKQVRGFSKDDINFLQSVGHLIAAAVARKHSEDEIIERSEQLQEVNRELEDFVYIVSHDLKEPLFAIEGISSRLYKHYKDVIDEKGNMFINRIKVNVELMAQKINEVMEVIKIGRVKYVCKNHNARAIVDDVINDLEDRITADKVDVMVQDNLPTVFCDENRLNDVFNNLVVNAIKFIGDNGKKKITIGCHENGSYYKFFVEDTGIGIRSEYQEMIFKVFRRLNDVDVEGTGVGLAIVKKIIELHNGKIWVESPLDDGKGSRFTFALPIVKEKDK